MKIMYSFLFLAVLVLGCKNEAAQKGQAIYPDKETVADTQPKMQMDKLFEEVNVVKMHLFATEEASPNADDYPYVGMEIPKALHQYLDEDLDAGAGPIYACYRTENSGHYILRVPGKYVSGDLALAKWDASKEKLTKISHLAYIWCDEGACNQQDAWLTDLDDDRDLELIIQEKNIDENGNVSAEQFEVMTDNGKGDFVPAEKALAELAVKDRYVMMMQ